MIKEVTIHLEITIREQNIGRGLSEIEWSLAIETTDETTVESTLSKAGTI